MRCSPVSQYASQPERMSTRVSDARRYIHRFAVDATAHAHATAARRNIEVRRFTTVRTMVLILACQKLLVHGPEHE